MDPFTLESALVSLFIFAFSTLQQSPVYRLPSFRTRVHHYYRRGADHVAFVISFFSLPALFWRLLLATIDTNTKECHFDGEKRCFEGLGGGQGEDATVLPKKPNPKDELEVETRSTETK